MARASSDATADTEPSAEQSAEKIGPGRVVLIVGPSGVGKDALLQGAAARLSETPGFHFPKRVINRPAHAAEHNDLLTTDSAAAVAQSDAYVLSWEAHGLVYAIPSAINAHISAGSSVVFNASRTIIAAARRRFATVTVVYISAARDTRAARLAMRGRETASEIATRLEREVETFRAADADHVIENEQSVEAGIEKLLTILTATQRA
ncbi:MAG: phosphonate metabolism protein/1,5-bisphosphokinase (PRPP-forming) PhnN [Pseudomonadota bacterium]